MNKIQASKRNFGIDALRIVSMLFVVILHILGKGGLLDNTNGVKNAVFWLAETVCYCAVNCYAMISGFVMYSDEEKPFRSGKYINLWTGVFFWSFGITAVSFILGGGNVGVLDLIKSALPIIAKQYWYFNAYTALFFLTPWLNKLIRALSPRELTRFCSVLFVLFTIVGLFRDPFKIDYGYSFVWLAVLYIFGAWLKKCEISQKISAKSALICSFFCIAVSWLPIITLPIERDFLLKYISPTIVIYSACMVVLFSKLRLSQGLCRAITAISPAAFGVYIIHEHPCIRCNFETWFGKIADLSTLSAVGCVVLCAVCIFIVCASAEKLRIFLFNFLRINSVISSYIKSLFEKIRTKSKFFQKRY